MEDLVNMLKTKMIKRGVRPENLAMGEELSRVGSKHPPAACEPDSAIGRNICQAHGQGYRGSGLQERSGCHPGQVRVTAPSR